MEAYLEAFERQMTDLEYGQGEWLVRLRPLLSDWANSELEVLSDGDTRSYDKTKATLLKAYAGAKGDIGYRVVTAERKKGQSVSHFTTQVYRQCRQWWQGLTVDEIAAKYAMAVTELQLPLPCRNYVQMRAPASIQELTACVETFFSERNSNWDDTRWKPARSYSSRWTTPSKPRDDSYGKADPQLEKVKSISGEAAAPRVDLKEHRKDREKEIICFGCNQPGHIVRNCPDRASRVNVMLQGKQNFVVDAKINGVHTKALLDSGAQVTVVPAALVPPAAYTMSTWKAAGLMSEGPLPIATVTVSVGDTMARIRVLAKEDLHEVLLGQDYPALGRLLVQGLQGFRPLTGVLGHSNEVMEEVSETNYGGVVEGGEDSLAEEAEDSLVEEVGDSDVHVKAVQTRAQKERELQQQQRDDELSAASGATPCILVDPPHGKDPSVDGDSRISGKS